MNFLGLSLTALFLVACGEEEDEETKKDTPSTEIVDADNDGVAVDEDCDDSDDTLLSTSDDADSTDDCDDLITNTNTTDD